MEISDVWTIKISNETFEFKPLKINWSAVRPKLKATLKNSDPNDPNGPWSFINGDHNDVYFSRSLLKAGFPIEFVDHLTYIYSSDLSDPHSTYYIEGQPTKHIRGVSHNILNDTICEAFGIKGYRGDFGGHGSAARAVSSAIYEHFTRGRHSKGNHLSCSSEWCHEAFHNYKQIAEEKIKLHDSGDHSYCRPKNCEIKQEEKRKQKIEKWLDLDESS